MHSLSLLLPLYVTLSIYKGLHWVMFAMVFFLSKKWPQTNLPFDFFFLPVVMAVFAL